MSSFFRLFGRFRKDQRGNIAVIFAIALLPILSFMGAAVDYSRANRARSSMQAAMDSTALMVSKDLSQGLITTAQVTTKAQSYFNGLYTDAEAPVLTLNATYTPGSGNTSSTVQVTGSGNITTVFMKIAGFPTMGFNTASTATWGASLLRVALVLDNTGSMNSYNKIGALRTASLNLVTQLSALAQNAGDVYISVVPFAIDVNVNKSNKGASWLRWDLYDSSISTSNCSGGTNSGYMSYATCLGHNYVWRHTPAVPPDPSTWNGCVTDRDQNFDTTNDVPLAGGTLYPTEQYSSCPVPVMGLSNDWTALSAKIAAMQPNGNTNQAIGLQLGWQSLTAAPFTVPAMDPNYKYNQVIILLTDGLNTEDRWYSNASSIDARQQKTCDNIKAAGITIYTVQVNTGSDPTSSLLQQCASDSSKFFLLTSSTQIVTTFNQIGTALSNLRLAL